MAAPVLTKEDYINILQGLNAMITSAQRQINAKNTHALVKETYKTAMGEFKKTEAKILELNK